MKEVRVRIQVSNTQRRGWDLAVHSLLLAALLALGVVRPAAAQAVKGEVITSVDNGYARLVFHLAEEVESQVKLANNILTISFQKPVDVSVDRLSLNSAGYIGAARRDPDGKAIRIALARKVTMNSVAAGERLFVDLLPDTWTGLAPGLPREVIEELARRAREAEKKILQQRSLARQNQMAPIRVRAVAQSTFTRYVFDLPELTSVAADKTRDKLTLIFAGALKFDLADAVATLPAAIASIESEVDQDSVTVRFTFGGKVDVRTFREDNNYVVDVTPAETKTTRQDGVVHPDEFAALAARQDVPLGGEAPKTPQPRQASAAPDDRAPSPEVSPPSAPPAPQPAPPPAAQSAPRAADEAAAARPAAGEAAGPAPLPAPPTPAAAEAGAPVKASIKRNGDMLKLMFPFAAPTPAAAFRRGDAIWLVFDTDAAISLPALDADIGRSIRSAVSTRQRDVAVVRLKLARPMLMSVVAEETVWTVLLGAEVVEPTRPLALSRTTVGTARSSVTIPVDDPRDLHRIEDPDVGDVLIVATALAPARGFLKAQDFVEFRVLPSTHGVVMQPVADDFSAELAADKIILTRPAGLTLSATATDPMHGAMNQRQVLDTQSWGFDRQADFAERKSELMFAAAAAPESKRQAARADLARFYLARDMAPEAKAVLDVALADQPATSENPTVVVLHAVCSIMMGRPEAGLKDLANPFVGNQYDAPLWRAFAQARLGKWAEAHEGFRNVEAAIGTLPLQIQRLIMKETVRAALEVGDITGATTQLHEFETIGIPRELEPTMAVLTGRLNEGLGRPDDARRAYQSAAESWDRPAAAQGRLRAIALRQTRGDIAPTDAVAELETLSAIWRGDSTEIEALQMLARLYTEEGRYREAFQVMRTAMSAHPNSEMTRRIQEEAAASFDSLFLAGRGDALPAIEALALFYDFRELTPIGRRGDEMIRRLADRLVSVDLLFQASELLQHQVDHRLQGAARAQVAARLAVIYLMDRKPDRALATLRATRTAELTNDLRNQRLLLEARALSESGRRDLAIEVIANIAGREAIRLRSDIYWAAKRWIEAAEQLELLYGDRWRDFESLDDSERVDILRAAVGYSLGDDMIGLIRFREKYAAKMGDGPDRRAFDVVTTPVGRKGGELPEIARALASVDTLEAFLRDLRARYPETGAMPPSQQTPRSAPGQAGPRPDPATTGTAPPRRSTSRTAQAR